MVEILTLGVYKTNEYKFEIIGFINTTGKFCEFELKDVVNGNRRLWDIGAITRVENFAKIGEYNIRIEGDCLLDRYLSKDELKQFLNSKKYDFMRFYNKNNIKFCVIKPSVVKRVYRNIYNKCFVELIADGTSKDIEIKDIRWVSYWEHIIRSNSNLLEDKQSHYTKFLNDRETYFIGLKEVREVKNIDTGFKKDNSKIRITSVFIF